MKSIVFLTLFLICALSKKLDDREGRVKSVNSVSQTLTQRSDWMKSMNN